MTPTAEALYEAYEEYAEEVTETIRAGMNRMQLAGFDELTVVQTQKITETLYKRVDKLNRKRYRELCGWVYEWVYVQYGESPPDKDWTIVVDDWLKGYDPVTGYVYDRELEAKRLKLVVDILTARETGDRNKLIDAVRTAANLLLTQSLQNALDLIGATETDAFEEAAEASGEAEDADDVLVQYHACNDSRTCGECKDDDGKIFTLTEAPTVPRHYRCRCWYTRVRK